MFCKKCGNPIDAQGNFCPKCGEPITIVGEPAPAPVQVLPKQKVTFADFFKIGKYKNKSAELEYQVEVLNKRIQDLGCDSYEQTKLKVDVLEKRASALSDNITKFENRAEQLNSDIDKKTATLDNTLKRIESEKKKIAKLREAYESIKYSCDNFAITGIFNKPNIDEDTLAEIASLSPSITLKLHNMDVKSLSKAFKENDKEIQKVFEQYASRYTTKSLKSIYKLMIIALRAELQNILVALKYDKLDDAVDKVKMITRKYLSIAEEGNKLVAGTLERFIGQIEYLFINAVKIEYNYYVKKEQARQEQMAIREQMKQEAAERKALEAEKKKVEAEERKYKNELDKLTDQAAASADDDEKKKLEARILELQAQLANVAIEKEKIVELANGRAGNVYVISNLGSFGENMFKVGMTRRLQPQDRVDELGDASVPFKFDVHSFIFSDDAVGLENKLHEILDKKRVNKVNRRKEFFYSTIDELEQLVHEIEPTAEFNKTMVAEEFRQSLSTDEVYSDTLSNDDIADAE